MVDTLYSLNFCVAGFVLIWFVAENVCSVQVHELSPDKLKSREVVHIDIANDPVASADYKEDEDPTKFKSQKTGRGPLQGPNWKETIDPVMTCYKLVTVEFKWFGLQVRFIWQVRWYNSGFYNFMQNVSEVLQKYNLQVSSFE